MGVIHCRRRSNSTAVSLRFSTAPKKTPADWLIEERGDSKKVGFDPWLHTEAGVERLRKSLVRTDLEIVPVARNPIDLIWSERPEPPHTPVYAHDTSYAGKSSAEKRSMLAEELKKKNCAAAVITDPASIAWLINVRGGDVPHTPLPLSFATIADDGKITWFIDPRKVTAGLEVPLGPDVRIEDISLFGHALENLKGLNRPIRVDPSSSAYWIIAKLRAAGIVLSEGEDLCLLPKACKNSVEIEGMRAAHRRDGASLTKFLAWLSREALTGEVTEIAAEEKLGAFRAANRLYKGPSFSTISGAGPNGAIVHYSATPSSNRKLKAGEFYLVDSGGQYRDGTTDVTRTVSIGTVSDEMRDRFTRVLKGHIAIAGVKFPEGTSGAEIDALARQYLWAAGLDYSHGTGHGVGSYLGVHEGPQGISKRNNVPFKPGMILSNEPGYYKPGSYGIRIENLLVVTEAPELAATAHKMLGFETLTLCPIDRNAIDKAMLTDVERKWLNSYHVRVRETLKPMLDKAEAHWLELATAAI